MDTPDPDLDELFYDLRVYDRQGRRIGYADYRRLHADLDYRFVARDRVGDTEVVTAWLGLDQGDSDRPWIFGTVTLTPDGRFHDDEESFSSTESEALATHAAVRARRAAEAALHKVSEHPDTTRRQVDHDDQPTEPEAGRAHE